MQFLIGIYLEAQVIDAYWLTLRRDRKVHSRILEHPLRIIRLCHHRLRRKQGPIEVDRGGKILDADMHVESFHGSPIGLKALDHERRARRAKTGKLDGCLDRLGRFGAIDTPIAATLEEGLSRGC